MTTSRSNPSRAARKRPWMLVAAAAIVFACAAGALLVVHDRSDDRSVAEHVDPEPLYMLPSDLPGWTSRSGSTSAGSTGACEGIVIGTPVDGMFIDPVAVILTPDPPDGFSADVWREVIAGGPTVFISPEEDLLGRRVVTHQSDTGWLTSSSENSGRNVSALQAVEVDSAGRLILRSSSLEVIASYNIPSGLIGESTYSEAHGPGNEYGVVETLSGEIPLLATVAELATPNHGSD